MKKTPEEMEQEIVALKAEVLQYKLAAGIHPDPEIERAIRQRMASGLDRHHARAVELEQRKQDAGKD